MRPVARSLAFLGVFTFSIAAGAAETAESPAQEEYAPARTGFQLGLRLSTQVPSGSLGGGSSLSDLFGPRVHLAIDIGSKLNPYLFFGGYVGGSYGLEGGDFTTACSATDAYGDTVSCSAESVDAGVVAVVTLLPAGFVDPWLGLTAGYEVQVLSYGDATGLFSGVSPSALMGVDFRIRNGDKRAVMSVGPYGGVTLQKYLTGSIDGSAVDTSAEPFHAWIHVGVRLTFPS
jgi:hypothetical protein